MSLRVPSLPLCIALCVYCVIHRIAAVRPLPRQFKQPQGADEDAFALLIVLLLRSLRRLLELLPPRCTEGERRQTK